MLKNLLKTTSSRFVVVGLTSTALDFLILIVLHTIFGVPVLLANITSTSVAFCFSFFANRHYTFRSSGNAVVQEMLRFVIVTLFGLWVLQTTVIMLITPSITQVLSESLALIFAKLAATLASTIWNYVLYARYVFRIRQRQTPHHIVLDTRIIETSTGRYMQRLLENINDHHTDNMTKYTALVPGKYVEKWQTRLSNIAIVAADQKWYSLSEQLSLPILLHKLKPDLVHFTMPQQPLLWFGDSITTIHDMTLVRFSNSSSGSSRMIYAIKKFVFTLLMHVVFRRSNRVIVPTKFVKNDIMEYFHLSSGSSDHIIVTYEAGDTPGTTPEPIDQLVDKNFIFYVGNAFPYKNVQLIIDAFRLIQPSYPNLCLGLAGKKDVFYKQLETYVTNQSIANVYFLGFITDGQKRWAMQHTKSFVTASLSEGFCIPLLEAMCDGAPVIASNATCIPEVIGNAGILFDASTPSNLAEALHKVLDNTELSGDLRKLGAARVKKFSWQKMTNQTVDIYRTVLTTTTPER